MNTNLPICKLCKKKRANQTGSHIFSFSLIKGAINENGEVKRDKEISFKISLITLKETYFGRSINPEKIKEVKGRELTDEEIEKNINPFTINNLVCLDCEKRFGTVETYFKDKVYDKLLTDDFKEETDIKGTAIKICEGVDNRIIRLFIYVNIWRAAAAKFTDWKIKPKEEEELRQILDEHLGMTQEETIKLVEETESQFSHLPLIVTYLETEEGEETGNPILIDRSKMPYCLIMNNIIVQFFVKESHARGSINWVYGISDMIDNKEHLNFKEDEFRIGKLNVIQRKKYVEILIRYMAREFQRNTMARFKVIFQEFFDRKPTVDIMQKVMHELNNVDLPLGYKYTLEHITEVFVRNMLEFHEKLK
ncbi:hypothetical protein [Flavobacterium filum]|uniref:hypothetical protein n=1 Tax=Flavobacterium filum TaxID=370974 RepID=UPI0023F444FF|nr:hypothetical protein [Flavobacterium filum]